MFKTQIVDSGNFNKSIAFRIIMVIVILWVIFILAFSYHLFGKESAINTFMTRNNDQVIQYVSIGLCLLALVVSMIRRSRLRNPVFLGNLEMDETGFQQIQNETVVYSGKWRTANFIVFKYHSSANRKNPRGCMNFLTIVDQNGARSFEIEIENSLIKADLGDFLREINLKVPVKVKYTLPIKKIFRDNDFKI